MMRKPVKKAAAPATVAVESSGATGATKVENHPAVDADPRGGVPEHATRIDFNDPTQSAADAVAEQLAAQD
jgi:hypothetical protein